MPGYRSCVKATFSMCFLLAYRPYNDKIMTSFEWLWFLTLWPHRAELSSRVKIFKFIQVWIDEAFLLSDWQNQILCPQFWWPWSNQTFNSSKNHFFCFAADVLIQICHLWEAACPAQGHISRTHGCWWTRWLQTCNHLITTTLLPPLINNVSCTSQDWCRSRSSWAQHLKNFRDENAHCAMTNHCKLHTCQSGDFI